MAWTIVNNTKAVNELARKSMHIGVCIISYSVAHLLSIQQIIVIGLAVCILTTIFEKLGYLNFFQDVKRKSWGQYFMAFGVFGALIGYQLYRDETALAFAFLCLGLADPLAVFGKPIYNYLTQKAGWNWLKPLSFGGKTITGAIIFGSVTTIAALWLISISGLNPSSGQYLNLMVAIAALTIIEFYSIWGLDNLFIPIFAYYCFSILI